MNNLINTKFNNSAQRERQKSIVLIMLSLSFVCMLFGGARIHISGNLKGIFLVWNLFLAWIPLLVAYFLSRTKQKLPILKLILPMFLWLLFLPNAPYIITDLIHLRPRDGIPMWYDAIVIFFFAFHGLLLGIISTLFIHEVLEKYFNKVMIWTFLTGSFILTGYGIYLGRFLRWNSWDIVIHPIDLLQESFLRLTHPVAIVITGIFSLIMMFSYLIFYHLIHLKNNSYDTKII